MPTTKTAYIQANDIGEQLITPKGVVLHVDNTFIRRIQSLRSVCSSNHLESVSVARSPDVWLPDGLDSELHLSTPRLVVTPDLFWFEDQPKHARDHIECIPVRIDALVAWFANDEDALMVSDDDGFEHYIQSVIADSAGDPPPFPPVQVFEATPPPPHDDIMRAVLASFVAVGDVFTDAPECAASVEATENLLTLADLLRGDTETVCSGTLMAGASDICEVDIRADGSMVVNLPNGFDPSERAWSVVTTAGNVYRVKRFEGDDTRDSKWLIDELEAFYANLVGGS
jgi:hypothetical protein